ncbi:hypothetical protein Q4485_01345 [Granulosicoccaceae sp. 1_MG-2023]|nr:hypothetical protein [Granulosicoccaceae sp. 1_MG-2023]
MSQASSKRHRSLSRALQKAPQRFRDSLTERARGDDSPDQQERRRLLDPPQDPRDSSPQTAAAEDLAGDRDHVLFNEGAWQVTPAYVKLAGDTFVVRMIGRLQRTNSKAPRHEIWLGLGFTLAGLFAVLMYLALGVLKFNALAIVCLLALLLAFAAMAVNLRTLRSRAGLTFYDEHNTVLCRITDTDQARVDRLEAAVREAISVSAERAPGYARNAD